MENSDVNYTNDPMLILRLPDHTTHKETTKLQFYGVYLAVIPLNILKSSTREALCSPNPGLSNPSGREPAS
jgi:hypothetical protein